MFVTLMLISCSLCIFCTSCYSNTNNTKDIEKDFCSYYKRINSQNVSVQSVEHIKVLSADSLILAIKDIHKLNVLFHDIIFKNSEAIAEFDTQNKSQVKLVKKQYGYLYEEYYEPREAYINNVFDYLAWFRSAPQVLAQDSIVVDKDHKTQYNIYEIQFKKEKSSAETLTYYALKNMDTKEIVYSDKEFRMDDIENLSNYIEELCVIKPSVLFSLFCELFATSQHAIVSGFKLLDAIEEYCDEHHIVNGKPSHVTTDMIPKDESELYGKLLKRYF